MAAMQDNDPVNLRREESTNTGREYPEVSELLSYYDDVINSSDENAKVFSSELLRDGINFVANRGGNPKALIRSKLGKQFSAKEFEVFLFSLCGIVSSSFR